MMYNSVFCVHFSWNLYENIICFTVREPMAEDESFYIDLNDDKPRLKSQQMSSVMFQVKISL